MSPFNTRSKAQRWRSQGHKNILMAIEWRELCTLSSVMQPVVISEVTIFGSIQTQCLTNAIEQTWRSETELSLLVGRKQVFCQSVKASRKGNQRTAQIIGA